VSDEDVKIIVAGTDAGLLALWQRQNAEILKNQKALLQMGQAGEKAGQQIGSAGAAGGNKLNAAFSGAVQTMLGIGSAVSVVTLATRTFLKAVEEIKREYEHLRGQQSRAGQAQVAAAPAQREMFENLGNDKTLTPQQANAAVARISEKASMAPADVFKVMSTALSFKARDETAASVVPLVEMAAQMSPEDSGAASANVKALQAIRKAAPNAGAKDIQGFLIGAKLASPVVNNENFGAYTAPGIAQLMSLGNSPQEAAAFQGALGQGIGDEEGRVTANASITFAKQMKEMLPKVQGGLFQQLAFLQTPEGRKAKAKLLGPLLKGHENAKKIGLEGEAKAFATLVGFIKGEGRYSEMLQGTLSDTPGLEGAGSFVDQRQAALDADPLQKNFRLQRLMKSAAERTQLGRLESGKQGITIGALQEHLDNAGVSERERDMLLESYKVRTEGAPEGIANKAGQLAGLIPTLKERQSPEEAAAGVMQFEAARLRIGQQMHFEGNRQVGTTNESLAAAKALEAGAKHLREMARQENPGPQPKAGPAAANDRRAGGG